MHSTPDQQKIEGILKWMLDGKYIGRDHDKQSWFVHPKALQSLAAPLEAANARIAELEAERDKLRKLYSAAWAECQAWRSAYRCSRCACVLGMSDRDATCATHDYLRREAGEVQR